MTLLQKIHAVLLNSLRKRTCAVNRTLDYFHPSLTLQTQTDIFNFRVLLYTVEVTATQSRKLKVDPTSTETIFCDFPVYECIETKKFTFVIRHDDIISYVKMQFPSGP